MSTYAVFGMTRPMANQMARKIVDRRVQKIGEWPGEHIRKEWEDDEADKIMSSQKIVKLSDMFDAPSFAEDYRRLARKLESRDLHIKAHVKSSFEKTKTGRPKLIWESA